MSTEQKAAKWEKFVSLAWYDGFIEFLFRFVAKTSEPLLALGIVISAVDFLTKGALLTNDQPLTMAWAWTQAIAIEASSGVVFVYALQSFKSKDKVKGWLYLVLSVLLAITGGAMLLLQLVANLTVVGESALPTYVVIGLAVLRVVVSIGYVYMCRAKHIRFTDLEEVKHVAPLEAKQSISDETVQLILAKLAKLEELEDTLARHKAVIIQEVAPPLALPEANDAPPEAESEAMPYEASLEAQIALLLSQQPELPYRKIAEMVDRPPSTVYRYYTRLKQQAKQDTPGEAKE